MSHVIQKSIFGIQTSPLSYRIIIQHWINTNKKENTYRIHSMKYQQYALNPQSNIYLYQDGD